MAGRLELVLLGEFAIATRGLDELVEDVIVALAGALKRDAALLEQVVLDYAALYHPLAVEADLHELAEARAVVVAHRLRVACGQQLRRVLGLGIRVILDRMQ